MADKRISGFPAATQWHPDAFIPQDNPAGLTEKVTPAQVETKLEADGFIKAASPSLGQVAAYTAGGWAPIKLADANIDAAAAIGWGKISKTGSVATDVGALASLTLDGAVDANSINSSASCTVKFQGVTSWENFPFSSALMMAGKGGSFTQLAGKDGGVTQCWSDLTDGTTYRRNYATSYGWVAWAANWDSYNLPVGSTGKALLATASQAAARSAISALPIANPTPTGTLTAPDVVVSNLAGTGTRAVAADSTGKLTAQPTIALDVGASTTGTGEQTLFTGSYAPSKAEVSVRGYTGGEPGAYTIRVKDNGNLIIEESFPESSQFVIRFSTSTATDCIYDMISGPNSGPFSAKIGYVAIGAMPNGSLTITGQSSTALDGIVLRQVITSQGG